MKLYERIKKDQALASKLSSEDLVKVKPVTGKIIEVCIKDISFPAGNNTWISEDGQTMYSKIDGYAFWNEGLLNIDNMYHIKGDVNYATGNINFNGSVVIDGDVRSGFRVEATDSIYIKGNVDAATVYSQNGDISVQYGILGKGRAKIIAGGNIQCGFIQNATVGAKNDVNIDHYSFNSTISAGGKVSLPKNEGLIRGGCITATKGIIANEVGSIQDQITELVINKSNSTENISNLLDIGKKRTDLLIRISSLEKRHKFIKLLKKELNTISTENKNELEFIDNELLRLKEKIKHLDQEEVDYLKQLTKEAHEVEIKILGKVHQNVKIQIEGLEYFFQESEKNVRIYRVKDELIVESLSDKKNHIKTN